jgi:uncharacterized protein YdhG (YjbR/CyaY superfamily)
MSDRTSEAQAAKRAAAEAEVLADIAAMAPADRAIAERLHAVVMEAAPDLAPRLWYKMPAWAKDGEVLCFFQAAGKFKTRYSTFGFQDVARLDDGSMWPVAFAIAELTADDEARIAALVKRAVD